MLRDSIIFLVTYTATHADGQTTVCNECEFNAHESVEYFQKHGIELDVHDVYNTRYFGKKTYPLDEPIIPLTRAAKKLIDARGPATWVITIERISQI